MEKLFVCDDCGKPTSNQKIIEFESGNLAIHRCDECQDKFEAEIEWQNEQFREDDVICPWCGRRFSDYWEMVDVTENPYEEFEGEAKCPGCGETFELEIEIICKYTTRKPSGQFNYSKWLKGEA